MTDLETLKTWTQGTRVRVLEPGVDLYPVGFFPPGTTGTVTFANHDAQTDVEVAATVALDDEFPGLAEWDNQLYVYLVVDGTGISDCTVSRFERVE